MKNIPQTKEDMMENEQYMFSGIALQYLAKRGLRVSKETLIDWCKKHSLGHQMGGVKWGAWIVDKEKLDNYIKGVKNG